MNIRTATFNDLEQISKVEAQCFPAAEAATKEEFADRLHYYGDHFWLMFDHEKLIAFVDGFVTDEPDLYDEMYEKASLHNPQGAWQMIFGVNTLPSYRCQGYAGQLIQYAIDTARKQHRKALFSPAKTVWYLITPSLVLQTKASPKNLYTEMLYGTRCALLSNI